jgi:hypothetical protein
MLDDCYQLRMAFTSICKCDEFKGALAEFELSSEDWDVNYVPSTRHLWHYCSL